jgi:transcriptional regulator with XRE-family HTH domain
MMPALAFYNRFILLLVEATHLADRDTIQTLIGKRIRQARERAGMTQETLAEKVGRNQRSISQIESATRLLPAADLLLFAQALGVSISYFFADVQVETTAGEDLAETLLKEFARLPTVTTRKAAIQLVRTLSEAVLNPTDEG